MMVRGVNVVVGNECADEACVAAYAWAGLPMGSVVVDVGAGVGTSAMLVARAFPHLRFVIQDTPKVVQDAQKHWKGNYPEAVEEGRVAFQEADFFQPQPPLPTFSTSSESLPLVYGSEDSTATPAVYILKNILHNWSNKYCARLLTRLRESANDDTRLLIIGTIMANLCRQEDSPSTKVTVSESDSVGEGDGDGKGGGDGDVGGRYEEAPKPLLPNYGAANEMAYTIDITMLTCHNAQERTLGEMHALLRSSGWEIKRVKRSNPPENFFDPVVAAPIPGWVASLEE